jgi:hypothetical protein
MENQNEDFSGIKMKAEDLGYKSILLFHCNKIGSLSMRLVRHSGCVSEAHNFSAAVMTLESFLSPYLDNEYKEEVKKVYQEVRKKEEKKPSMSNKEVNEHLKNVVSTIDGAQGKLGALLKLMARRNLLLGREKRGEL